MIPATDSGPKRPPIPIDSGHLKRRGLTLKFADKYVTNSFKEVTYVGKEVDHAQDQRDFTVKV